MLDGLLVQNRQGAGEAEADRADVRVGFSAESGAAGAEHFALGVDLAVDFQTDGDDVILAGHMRGKG